ncbi:uncharacterized protein BXZ73DRAFT_91251 [Epithele typhae]|uniref:uncharacterized protein n=1 Tax=Epithele typhae TaxID=378194 RepID=UPI0020085891|nr:uncharacterized protein BXZ73DRAFT_91251 [Epithele typhae]KAH9924680.1 hypothetical protein BXZ73DRAFT_91251 [Epithele typhae]
MSKPIIFYDIPCLSKSKVFSPHTWKIRLSLNFKGLPYKTVWVEYPDIQALCRKIGASAGDKAEDGTPIYTLPAIYDPNTKTTVSDSMAIARYLDKTYPDTPRLIPPGTDVLTVAFEKALHGTFAPPPPFRFVIIPAAFEKLRAASQPYFRATREKRFNKKIEDIAPKGSEFRAECWRKTEEGFSKMAKWYEADGEEKLLVMGDKGGASYADFVIAGVFSWFRDCLGEESEEWKSVEKWDGGRWIRLLSVMEQYSTVDVGEEVRL